MGRNIEDKLLDLCNIRANYIWHKFHHNYKFRKNSQQHFFFPSRISNECYETDVSNPFPDVRTTISSSTITMGSDNHFAIMNAPRRNVAGAEGGERQRDGNKSSAWLIIRHESQTPCDINALSVVTGSRGWSACTAHVALTSLSLVASARYLCARFFANGSEGLRERKKKRPIGRSSRLKFRARRDITA